MHGVSWVMVALAELVKGIRRSVRQQFSAPRPRATPLPSIDKRVRHRRWAAASLTSPRPSVALRSWRELVQRPLVDEPCVTQNPHPVAEPLDLAEDVRGEEIVSGRAPSPRERPCSAEHHLHQRLEAAGRLVEEQQVRTGSKDRD